MISTPTYFKTDHENCLNFWYKLSSQRILCLSLTRSLLQLRSKSDISKLDFVRNFIKFSLRNCHTEAVIVGHLINIICVYLCVYVGEYG